MLISLFNSRDTKAPKLSLPSSSSSLYEINFPADVLIEILKRLPLKSLIRLTCVCKSWLALLTSTTFISAHVSHSFTIIHKGNPKTHLFKQPIDVHTETFRTKFSLFITENLSKHSEIGFPVGRKHFIVSSRDGLLSLFDFYSKNPKTAPLILWNPSIRKELVVPAPVDGVVDLTPGGFPPLIFGFGSDPLSNDYKVVRVAYFNGGGSGGGSCFRAHVYSLGIGRWRSLDMASLPLNLNTIRWRGVYLKGVIHWVCNVIVGFDGNGWIHRSILTFNLGSEEFGEMKMPKELAEASNQTIRVVSIHKSSMEVLGIIHNDFSALHIWVMEKYGDKESWVKLFTVGIGIRNDFNVVVLSDEVVAVQLSSGEWISYDVHSKETKKLMTKSGKLDYVDTYVESLVLLGKHNYGLPGARTHIGLSRYTKRKAKSLI